MKTNVEITRCTKKGSVTLTRIMSKTCNLLCILTLSLFAGSAAARADAVLDWNVIAVNTAIANKQNPFSQARSAATVQLAVFETVNSIAHKYQPYLGTITAPSGALPDAAAIEAVYQVLIAYFPASQSTLIAALTIDGRSHPLPDCARLGILDRSVATAERDLRARITANRKSTDVTRP